MFDLIMSAANAGAGQLPGQAWIRQITPWLFLSSLFKVLMRFALVYTTMGLKTT